MTEIKSQDMPVTESGAVPTPVSEERDDIGRLIAATYETGRAHPDAGSDNGWLVAVDGSDHSLRAVSQAARLASESHARASIDLVNVQPWLGKEAAETELPQRGWAATAPARALLDAAGVLWRVHVVMGEAAPQIVRLAEALGSRGIIIGARGLSSVKALLLGSVAYKVIHTATVSVLVTR